MAAALHGGTLAGEAGDALCFVSARQAITDARDAGGSPLERSPTFNTSYRADDDRQESHAGRGNKRPMGHPDAHVAAAAHVGRASAPAMGLTDCTID